MRLIIPYANFAHAVAALDDTILKRQRLDCLRLLCYLGSDRLKEHVYKSMATPGIDEWNGYYSAAALWLTFLCWEWEARGNINTLVTPFNHAGEVSPGWPGELPVRMVDVKLPPFIGDPDYHAECREKAIVPVAWKAVEIPAAPVIVKKPAAPSKPTQLEMF